ncbi:MAG: hypothetical protein ABJH52_17180 [Henriciella sp.]
MDIKFRKVEKSHYSIAADGKEIGEIKGGFPIDPDIRWQGLFVMNGWTFNVGCESLKGCKEVFSYEVPRYAELPPKQNG